MLVYRCGSGKTVCLGARRVSARYLLGRGEVARKVEEVYGRRVHAVLVDLCKQPYVSVPCQNAY